MMMLSLLLVTLPACILKSVKSHEDFVITNPYYSGCLTAELGHQRVCNSDDPPSAVGVYCLPPDPHLDYLETRINIENWDSVVSSGWLLQILLSEILGVPTTVETGILDEQQRTKERRSFYDPENELDYKGRDVDHPDQFLIVPSSLLGCDCRLAQAGTPCAHVRTETWDANLKETTRKAINEKMLEHPQATGLLGQESWMVTKFTAQKDPTLVSYHGYVGEQNRQKLAETFLRPTTWKQYCEEESPSNCTVPDKTAQRPPNNEDEEERLFFPGQYTGYFRATPENDCEANPNTCSGHAANYPCGWTSRMETSIYHLDMALNPNSPEGEPMPYSYQQVSDMWHAANATKSNLLMMWFTPDQLYGMYLGQDAEMQRVALKPTTRECLKATPTDECSSNLTDRVGTSEAACGNPPLPLYRLVSGCLASATSSSDIPEAIHSPAYEAIRRFQVDDQHMQEIFDYWQSRDSPREAICNWAKDNVDFLLGFVPRSFPRITQEQTPSRLGYALIGLGSLTTLLVLFTGVLVQKQRNKPSIQYAQLTFLNLILAGSLLVAIGAILSSIPVTIDASCVAQIWFINMGYTLAIVPTLVKIYAINELNRASMEFRRFQIPREKLFGAVVVTCIVFGVFLLIWTLLDPPQKTAHYTMTSSHEGTPAERHLVEVGYYCSEKKAWWQYGTLGWNAALLFCASVLAFQNRNTLKAFNESRILGILIYSNFVFVMLRCITFMLSDFLNGTTLEHLRSLIYSVDTACSMFIYFVPKLFKKTTEQDRLHMFGAGPRSGASKTSGLESSGCDVLDGSGTSLYSGDLFPNKTTQTSVTGGSTQQSGPKEENIVSSAEIACPECGHTWKKKA